MLTGKFLQSFFVLLMLTALVVSGSRPVFSQAQAQGPSE